MEVREALVALNLVDHVGPIRLQKLLERFGDPRAVLAAAESELLTVDGVGEGTAHAIAHWESTVDLAAELKRAKAYGCRILIQDDPDYPELLREIYDPPIVLYLRGSLEAADRNALSIIGSRLSTAYGLEAARKLGFQLAHMGLAVVSGGARGIDTAAHHGALAAKGRTICVLGTGINLAFPPENAALFDRIAAEGAVITQFPFDRAPDRQTFPIRNRIVAGMTMGSVVVEANLESGALITAQFANDYGRQVFAVPGRIDSPRSRGCHDLIKKGAKLCEGPEDILAEFEYLQAQGVNRSDQQVLSGLDPSAGAASTTARTAGTATAAATLSLPVSATEQRVLEALGLADTSMDEVIRQSNLPAGTVSATLAGLEIKRLIRQSPGKLFRRTSG